MVWNHKSLTDKFFWTNVDVFHFSLPISDADTDIFLLLKQYLFWLMRQNKHPGAILPTVKHFKSAAERHCSAFFSSGHINKENNFTSYNYFTRENIHSCFALWRKIYIPGAILPPAKHDWLNWSHDKFDSITVSVGCDICKWVSLIDK